MTAVRDMVMRIRRPLVLAVGLWVGQPALALTELAERCEAALRADDQAAFQEVFSKLQTRKDVFVVEVRQRVEACLSAKFGEPWEYSFPDSQWLPVADAQSRLKAREDARQAASQAVADEAAARTANAERVATLVYLSCTDLLARDRVAAMTNPVCVDSFLANGLPAD